MSTDQTPARVVVTRSSDQASRLSDGLRRSGLIPVEVPLISLRVTDQHRDDLSGVLRRIDSFDWVTLTSPNAVTVFFDALDPIVTLTAKLAVVGPGTEEAANLCGFLPSLVAATASGEGLLNALKALPAGKVLCPQAAGARPTLADGLRSAGWDVTVVGTYEMISVRPSEQVMAEVATCDAIAFASSSSVHAWVEALAGTTGEPPASVAAVTPTLVVSIGPQTTATAQAAGFVVAAEAEPHTIDGLVAAVVNAVARSASPG